MILSAIAKARTYIHPEKSPPEIARLPGSRPIGPAASTIIYLRSIVVDLFHWLIIRRKRDRALINVDYERGEWSRQLRERSWEGCASLREYVDRAWIRGQIRAQIQGRLWSLPVYAYYRYRRTQLVAIIRKFARTDETLVELGSGAGAIAFELAHAEIWPRIVGLELSSTGREVARRVAQHLKVDRVEFGEIDLLAQSSQGFRRLANQTIFTHYCLEQLPDHTEQVFRNLVAARVRRAILIEPSFELLRWRALRDLASITYVLRQDYQRSIIRSARKLEKEGLIDIVHLERLQFVSSHRNAGTLLVFDVRESARA